MADLFRKATSLFSTTSNSFSTGEGETITPVSITDLPTDTEITLTFDRVDSTGVATPTKTERIIGTITGADFVISASGRGADGTSEQAHTSPVVEYIWNAEDWNDAVDALLVEHNQDGTHEDVTTNDLTVEGDFTLSGTVALNEHSMSRQAIINGNFDVWQRGTSFAATAGTSQYAADRWQIYSANTATTFSRQTASLDGSTYSMRISRDSANADTNTIGLYKSLESINSMKFRGKKLTLSFYAKAGADFSPTSSLITVQIRTGTGTDQNIVTGYTDLAYAINTTQAITTSWVKYTFTTAAVIGATVNQLGINFTTTPTGTAGAADNWEIKQVQLCAGSVALPFQPKSYAQELADCQRYCYAFTSPSGSTITNAGGGPASSTTIAFVPLQYPRPFRSSPTLTATAGDWKLADAVSGGIDVTALSIGFHVSGYFGCELQATVAAGLTQYRTYRLINDGSAARTMIFSAEL